MNQDDLNLIHAVRRGNPHAFSELVRRYRNYVFRIAYGILQNQADAEDVAQNTFVQVYQSLHTLRDDRAFSVWMTRITLRKATDWMKQQRENIASYDVDLLADERNSHEMAEIRMDLRKALTRLSDEQQTVLVLRELQGFSYAELAEILDVPVGTVRSRLHNARIQLRTELSREGGDRV